MLRNSLRACGDDDDKEELSLELLDLSSVCGFRELVVVLVQVSGVSRYQVPGYSLNLKQQ